MLQAFLHTYCFRDDYGFIQTFLQEFCQNFFQWWFFNRFLHEYQHRVLQLLYCFFQRSDLPKSFFQNSPEKHQRFIERFLAGVSAQITSETAPALFVQEYILNTRHFLRQSILNWLINSSIGTLNPWLEILKKFFQRFSQLFFVQFREKFLEDTLTEYLKQPQEVLLTEPQQQFLEKSS